MGISIANHKNRCDFGALSSKIARNNRNAFFERLRLPPNAPNRNLFFVPSSL